MPSQGSARRATLGWMISIPSGLPIHERFHCSPRRVFVDSLLTDRWREDREGSTCRATFFASLALVAK
jgi:hypothetical protein